MATKLIINQSNNDLSSKDIFKESVFPTVFKFNLLWKLNLHKVDKNVLILVIKSKVGNTAKDLIGGQEIPRIFPPDEDFLSLLETLDFSKRKWLINLHHIFNINLWPLLVTGLTSFQQDGRLEVNNSLGSGQSHPPRGTFRSLRKISACRKFRFAHKSNNQECETP